jgi:DNA-binding CsgD family transcriptional regulator/PAS domain-containing protein
VDLRAGRYLREYGESVSVTRSDSGSEGWSAARLGSPEQLPRVLGAALEIVLAARGQADKVLAIIERSPIPMTMHDGERRHIQANRPAQLLARASLAELRRLTIDDFMPPEELPIMDAVWARMLDNGVVAGTGPPVLPGRDGVPLGTFYWGMANALPGLHLFACAPTDWSEEELGVLADEISDEPPISALTPREIEVLGVAAEGLSVQGIAERLVASPHTIRTHLVNIYKKLGVSSRVGAVATGMRLGLIE